jgi:hypothetical protein
VEVKHEGDVFEDDPRNRTFVQQSKHLPDEAGATTVDSDGQAGLTEILAGKAADEQVDVFRGGSKIPDIPFTGGPGKALSQNRSRGFPNLAE